MSKDTEGVSVVSREGDRQRKKKSRANCVRLPVPVAAICEAGEKRMPEQRWEEVSPSGLRVQGWTPQLGAEVDMGLGPGCWAMRKEPARG